MEQWNLAIQKQLPGDWMMSATYMGNRTVHLTFNEPQNYAVYVPGQLRSRAIWSDQGRTVLDDRKYQLSPHPVSCESDRRQVLRRARQFRRWGQCQLQRRDPVGSASVRQQLLAHGKLYLFALPDRERSRSQRIGRSQDPLNRHAEYGNCLSGRRQVLNLSMVLRSPQFDSKWMRALLSNWQASPIFTSMSGTYSSVSLGSDNSLTGGSDRPNVTGNPNLEEPTISKWFDTAAFSKPATGSFGNSGKGTVLGPGAWNMDLALSRSFPISDQQKVDFRWEIFNIMNHVRYNNPVTNLSSGAFGQIQSARDPRIMQFALKYTF